MVRCMAGDDEVTCSHGHSNGVMSDGSSPTNRHESGRENILTEHSTENLLESDESIDC